MIQVQPLTALQTGVTTYSAAFAFNSALTLTATAQYPLGSTSGEITTDDVTATLQLFISGTWTSPVGGMMTLPNLGRDAICPQSIALSAFAGSSPTLFRLSWLSPAGIVSVYAQAQ